MVLIVDGADLRGPLLKALPRPEQLRHPWKCPDGTVSAELGRRVLPPVWCSFMRNTDKRIDRRRRPVEECTRRPSPRLG